MTQTAVAFTLDTLTRKRVEKFRREEKDARIHSRLSALLWLADGRSSVEVASLLGLCARTVSGWLRLYLDEGLDALRTLRYKGDPG